MHESDSPWEDMKPSKSGPHVSFGVSLAGFGIGSINTRHETSGELSNSAGGYVIAPRCSHSGVRALHHVLVSDARGPMVGWGRSRAVTIRALVHCRCEEGSFWEFGQKKPGIAAFAEAERFRTASDGFGSCE